MRYIPNTSVIRRRMLESAGLGTCEDLFSVIPADCRLGRPLDLPAPLDEPALLARMEGLAGGDAGRRVCLLGGGAYRHHVPAVVRALVSRAEFYTAYTPYQPEVSQGTLQAVFEYQTMVAELTGLDVSNASLYDGGSALAEAVLMAVRVTGRRRVILSRGINPLYREVVGTYLPGGTVEIVEAPLDSSGRTDRDRLAGLIDGGTACFAVQNPNFLGVVEDTSALGELRGGTDTLLVAAFTEALSLGILTPPGEWGADIAAGEGQSFGNPPAFGGPALGILACRSAHLRQMPGRLVGQTVDSRGETGYVLTLSTREQHIRRDKATSNICSNEALCALAAAVYLSTLGPRGLRELAADNLLRTRRAMDGLRGSGAWEFPVDGPVFNEFTAVPKRGARAAQEALRAAGFTGGLPVGRWYPELGEALGFCFTETVGDEDIDRFIAAAGGTQ
jgi:glycine dehydrogenase subunit 1